MGTLSKAIGGYGGYLCASQPVIDLIRNRARTLVYSTGLPPATVAAAIAALDLIEREPRLCSRSRSPRRAPSPARANLPEAQSPIVPMVIGDAQDCARRVAASGGRRASWWSRSARRPCRTGTARLRLDLQRAHPDTEIARLAAMVRDAHPGARDGERDLSSPRPAPISARPSSPPG